MAAVLMVLLVALGTLQWVWIGRISRAERDRLQHSIQDAADRFTEGFDRELVRMAVTFTPVEHRIRGEIDEWLADRLDWWRAEAPFPGLVGQLVLVRRTGPGLTFDCLDSTDTGYSPCGLPASFAHLGADLREGNAIPPLPEDTTGLVLALRHRGDPDRTGPTPAPRAYVLVEFDLHEALRTALPKLAAGSIGAAGDHGFSAAVVEARNPSEVLLRFGAGTAALSPEGADIVRPFFPVRPLVPAPGRGRLGPDRAPEAARESSATAIGPPGQGHSGDATRELARPSAVRRWLLLISHRAGSLEIAVNQARRRNLALGLSVLGLLAASSILLVVSSQRAQRLARQQLQFVAGVSHELRTPLTAITAAGQNLADGVVADTAQVRRYGAMIEQEGRRLALLVGRVLTFAGIRSGQRVYTLQPTALADLVDRVLEEARLALESRRFSVERDVPADLPPVMADSEALREALANLVDNAIKFSGENRWLAIRACLVTRRARDEITLTVCDRGPGISRSELPRVFEPFVRGSGTAVPGSGLGLSVVRHVVEGHGGTITVAGPPEGGTAVTVHLPAAPDGRESP